VTRTNLDDAPRLQIANHAKKENPVAPGIGGIVERKPERHEFRENYQPGRRMIAIGG